MKTRLFIALSALLMCLGVNSFAQTIQDDGYRTIGHITSDGTMQDSGYRTIGHFKSDGTVQDSGYRTIGHIKSDGTVQDSGYRTIGHAKNVRKEWVAFFFFFR